ncbi:EcsC family protein [Chryseolinea sp. H1M3-3]|uniref:EcsC family protein n=1 Tax=Chryseolinea sp. H1M3-3 TaxID=3034144 RepID=UPI0023ECBC11|nr:EcsC family protein [Chryseolinea sp. H1M3-3]
MTSYEQEAMEEASQWQQEMKLSPSLFGGLAKRLQNRINKIIPEKIHVAFTVAIKQMTRAVLLGSEFTTSRPLAEGTLEERELKIKQRIRFYKNTAATEGAITGAGGILLGLADFPIWLTLKMKMLHEIAALYGYDVKDYKERIYILYIFQITFSSQKQRNKAILLIENWHQTLNELPPSINEFDWRTFQLEYRDYIDVAKLLQLVPGIGAPIGAYVNHRLTQKLGKAAMNAYRLRWKTKKMLS